MRGGCSLTDWVMQTKSFVSLAPGVADPTVTFKDQRRHIKVLQAGCDNQTTLSATHDDDVRLRVHELHFALSLFRPFPVVREGVPILSCLFRVFLETGQARVHGITFPSSIWSGYQTENARSESESSHLKGENTLYPTNPWEELQGSLSEIKGRQVRNLEPMIQELFDARGATECTEIPGNCEDVAPERIVDEKVDDSCCVSGLNERCESREPLSGDLIRVKIFW